MQEVTYYGTKKRMIAAARVLARKEGEAYVYRHTCPYRLSCGHQCAAKYTVSPPNGKAPWFIERFDDNRRRA